MATAPEDEMHRLVAEIEQELRSIRQAVAASEALDRRRPVRQLRLADALAALDDQSREGKTLAQRLAKLRSS